MPTKTDIETARTSLKEIIRTRSFSTGKDIQLASGRASSFYFNMKPAMMHPEGAALITRLILNELDGLNADYVGGLEMGAVPLVSAVAPASHRLGHPVAAFFIRKQAKEHGTRSLVEGLAENETLKGKRVVILEDVTTTGGSSLQAVQAVQAEGGEVIGVITIVDRQEGADETFAGAGIPLTALFRAEDFK